MQRTFHTPGPISLYVELRAGDLSLLATDTDETLVEVSGEDQDDVQVTQRGADVSISGPRGRSGLLGSSSHPISVRVSLPRDSRLTTKVGSVDVRVDGRLGDSSLKGGSGDVRLTEVAGDLLVENGSGDVEATTISGDLRVKSGSGDVSVDRVDGETLVSSASGDVAIGSSGSVVSVKSASGDLRVRDAGGDVSLSTASGDLVVDEMRRGRLQAKNASGDITVGIPAGVPVWTDLSTTSGEVRSSLEGAGEPAEGQEYVELRAKTVSGDIVLEQR